MRASAREFQRPERGWEGCASPRAVPGTQHVLRGGPGKGTMRPFTCVSAKGQLLPDASCGLGP